MGRIQRVLSSIFANCRPGAEGQIRPRLSGRAIALAALFTSSLGSAWAAECPAQRLEQVRQLSQQLDPKVEAPALEVIRACPQQRDQALLWLTAYYRSRGEYEKAARLGTLVGGEASSERDRVLFKAIRGEPEELAARIRQREAGFLGDAESLLILSRALARNRNFTQARTHYAEYLALKPDDHDVAIEDAYTFLWQGRMRDAAERFQELDASADLDLMQRQLVREGLTRSETEETEVAIPVSLNPPAVDLTTEMASSSFHAFSRTTTGANYRWKDFAAAGRFHWLSSLRPGQSSYGAAEGAVSYADRFGPVSMRAMLGAFNAGSAVPTGELLLDWRLPGGMSPYVGAAQDALAKDVPLPGDLSGKSRSTLFFGLRLRSTLDYRFEFRSFGGWTSGTRHVARVHIPLGDFASRQARSGNLSVRLLGENERFTSATPYLYSPRMNTALRATAVYSGEFAKDLSGTAQIEYGQVFESPQAGSGLSFGSSASLMGAGLDLGYAVKKSILAHFRLRLDRTQGDQGTTTYSATTLSVGISFQLDNREAAAGASR